MIYFIAAVAALTGFLFGFDEGIISGVLENIKAEFSLTQAQVGFMMGLLPFGALLSAFITGRVADWIGRRPVLFSVPIFFSIGTLLICTGIGSYELFCVARFFLGISIGISVVIGPLYIAETAPKESRGKLVACFQLAITLGIFVSYTLNLINASMDVQMPWRWMFASGFIPALLIFIGAFFLPESPRWLCSKKRHNEAQTTLQRLFSAKIAAESLTEIETTIKKEKKKILWKEVFSKKIRPVLVVGVLLFFFQQLSGINVIIYYAPIIFEKMQLGSHVITLLATVGIGAVNVLSTFIAIRFVEKLGRRTLFIWGFACTAICLALIAIMTYVDIPDLRWISGVALFVYIIAFAASIGPLPWVMMPEIFPLNVRGEGSSISAGGNWLFNTLVVSSFPILLSTWGISGTFTFYALSCVAGLLFIVRYLPETKRLSLEKIEAHVHSGKPFRLLGRR